MDTLLKKVMDINTWCLLLQTRTKKVLEMYTKLWNEINQIETINGGKPIKYKKDFMKIRF